MFKRISALLLVVVFVALALAAYYLRDPNQFKQDLQDLAAEQSGYQVTINGDIRWRWALPFGVSAENIAATADSETITVDRLTLGISFGSLFAAFDDWKINTLHLQDVYWEDSESIIRISDFHLQDFRTGVSSPFAMQVGYESTDPDPIIVTADIVGRLNYGDNDVLRFADTKVSSNLAVGTCQGAMNEAQRATGPRQEFPQDLLPLNDLLDYDLALTCDLADIPGSPVPLTPATLKVANQQGNTHIQLSTNNFWAGTLNLDTHIDLAAQPLRWTVKTNASGIDSTKFVDWANVKQNWQAKLEIDSTLTMRGNSEDELLSSIAGTANLDGGTGSIDISALRNVLNAAALISGKDNPVKDWPEELGYQELTAQWRAQGKASDIEFTLDNIRGEASGAVDFVERTMDMDGWLRIDEPTNQVGLRLPEELMNTKLPMNCQGPLVDPKCRPDKSGLLNLLRRTLTGEKAETLRNTVEKAIEEKVPDKLKESLRGLIGRFGKKDD